MTHSSKGISTYNCEGLLLTFLVWLSSLLLPDSRTIGVGNEHLSDELTGSKGLIWAFVFDSCALLCSKTTICSNCWWVYFCESYISVLNSIHLCSNSFTDSSSYQILCLSATVDFPLVCVINNIDAHVSSESNGFDTTSLRAMDISSDKLT